MIQRLIAILVYEDIPAAHDFLVEAFGFTAGGVERDKDGNAVHGEVTSGDATIWLHRVTAEHQMAPPRALPTVSGGIYVQVDDVDAHFQRAHSHGATTLSEPQTQPYGFREYRATDPEGHHWWFGQAVQNDD